MTEASRPEPAPRVAVVVATHDRAALLGRLLDSLAAQDVAPQVVVVDDASADDTPQRLADWAAGAGTRRCHLRTPGNVGPARARNRGWRTTTAEWIAFTDDDCVATPAWVGALLSAADRHGADLVQGCTRPDPARAGRLGPWAKSLRVEQFNHRFQAANLLVRRGLLEQIGGFDESFPFAGEDADLGWRALEAGAVVAFAPDAVVHHEVWDRSFGQWLRERPVWAELVRVVARHPASRQLLVGRWFYARSHVVVVVGLPALLGLGITVSWWLPPGVVGLWAVADAVRTRRGGQPLRRRLLRGVQVLVGATWETIAFARASLRYRTLVL